MFEDVGRSGHVHDVKDDEFAESCEQVSPLVKSLDLVGFILLVALCRRTGRGVGLNLTNGGIYPMCKAKVESLSVCLTHALALVVLVDEDVVQDEGEQLFLQSAVRVEDERLEAVPAAGHQLVTEDHQQVTEKHERLKETQGLNFPTLSR